MKNYLLAAGLLLGLVGCSGSTEKKPVAGAWQSFAVDEQLTVQLAAAKELDAGLLQNATRLSTHTRAWMARAPGGLCAVMRIPLSNSHRIERQDTAQLRTFYQDLVRGALTKEEHAHLLKHSYFHTAGGSGAEIMYTAWDAVARQRRVLYMRCLELDSITYNFIFRPTDKLDSTGTAGAADRRRFFDSITVKP
jgi:hypothetical protein